MIDSVSGFVVQIGLFVLLFVASDADLGLSRPTRPTSAGWRRSRSSCSSCWWCSVVVIALVRPVRRRVVDAARQAGTALRVLRSPTKLLQLFGGNVLSQVLFAVAFAACVEAFHESVPLTELLLINTVVSLFAGLLPCPAASASPRPASRSA